MMNPQLFGLQQEKNKLGAGSARTRETFSAEGLPVRMVAGIRFGIQVDAANLFSIWT